MFFFRRENEDLKTRMQDEQETQTEQMKRLNLQFDRNLKFLGDAQEKEKKQLQDFNSLLQNDYKNLEQEMETLKLEHTETLKSWHASTRELEAQIEIERRGKDELQIKLNDSEETRSIYEKQCQDMADELKVLKNRLKFEE